MQDPEIAQFVQRSLEEFQRRRAAGEALQPADFARAAAGGDEARAQALLRALEAASTEPGVTLPLPPGAPPARGQGRLIDNRYRVERELGEGGFGVVYLVRDELFGGARRALKTLRKDLTTDPGVAQRFRNEMVVVKALSHPLVPRFHNDGRTPEGEFYYVMDYVEGRGLDVVLRREGPLQPDRIVRLIRQLLDVLAYAHGKGVFHRDLKPANILLVREGTDEEEVRVLDFGIAKILSRDGEFADMESMHTLEGGAIGTPHYMAPEQVTGQGKVSEKTDIYALGVIVYQMCSGRVPFTGKTSMEVAAARLTQAPPPLDEDTPEWLRELVMSLLERQQEKRPGTQALREGLDELVLGQRGLRRSLGFIGAGIFVVGLGVAWLLYESGRTRPDEGPPPAARPAAPGGAAVWGPVQVQRPPEGLRTADPDVEVTVLAKGHSVVRIGDLEVPVGPGDRASTTLRVATDVPTAIVVRAADGTELERRNVFVDTRPPRLRLDVPQGVLETRVHWLTRRTRLELTGRIDDGEHGALPERPVTVAGAEAITFDGQGGFRAQLVFDEGLHNIEVRGQDAVGLPATYSRTLYVDLSPPRIHFATDPGTTQKDRLRIEGRVEDASDCIARLQRPDGSAEPVPLALDSGGRFAHEVSLQLGANEFEIEAQDALGHVSRELLRVERASASASVVSFEPASGRTLGAAEGRVRLAARTNLGVARLEVTRGGQRLEVGFTAENQGFSAELPLDFGANVFRLVPYDARDVPGEPLDLTYVRELPPLPAGCSLPADLELDERGRPTRVLHERSGTTLVLIPGGALAARTVPPFYLGRTEVTVGELTRWRPGFYDSPESRPAFWDEIAAERDRHPATRVGFEEARALCAELGLRLPTTLEWEFAGRGPEGRAFPWGDDERPAASNADAADDGWPRTAPVASFPLDRSPFGVYDLAGNVSEWCLAEGDARPALRGGNWSSEPARCRLDLARNPPSSSSDTIGFRVALDAPASPR